MIAGEKAAVDSKQKIRARYKGVDLFTTSDFTSIDPNALIICDDLYPTTDPTLDIQYNKHGKEEKR